MAEEIDFENGRNSNFEGLVTLTLSFDPAIRHIVLQQSSTFTYIPNFIQIEETFCGRTDVRTFFPSILLGRLSEVDLIIIISTTVFMVLSSWQSHCESSPGSFDECRMAPLPTSNVCLAPGLTPVKSGYEK